MAYLALSIALLGLLIGMRLTRFVGRVGAMVGDARHTVAAVRSRELYDAEKELIVQRAALGMFGELFAILGRILAVLAGPVLFLLLCLSLGLFTPAELEAALTDIDFLVVSSLLMLASWRMYA